MIAIRYVKRERREVVEIPADAVCAGTLRLSDHWNARRATNAQQSLLQNNQVKLSAFPGFLQGGARFQLRLTLPAADVSKIYEDATRIAKDFYDRGGIYKSTNSKKGGLPGTNFYTSDDKHQTDFPEDYRVFVIAAQSPGGNTWEHLKSYGVVVSKQRNEVIYFAENS